jgi:hypothetical protein
VLHAHPAQSTVSRPPACATGAGAESTALASAISPRCRGERRRTPVLRAPRAPATFGRRASGYRHIPAGRSTWSVFIKQAQALGFSLGEVEELLRLRGAVGQPTSALQAREVAAAKVRDIDEKVRQLGALRHALGRLGGRLRTDVR